MNITTRSTLRIMCISYTLYDFIFDRFFYWIFIFILFKNIWASKYFLLDLFNVTKKNTFLSLLKGKGLARTSDAIRRA